MDLSSESALMKKSMYPSTNSLETKSMNFNCLISSLVGKSFINLAAMTFPSDILVASYIMLEDPSLM